MQPRGLHLEEEDMYQHRVRGSHPYPGPWSYPQEEDHQLCLRLLGEEYCRPRLRGEEGLRTRTS